MKKLLSILILTLACITGLHAQELAVQSFVLAETDITANTPGTMVKDQNGNVCALIKVETTQKGFTFDVGVLGVMSVVEQPAEIWVYVPFGTRKITIQHPQLGILRDYQIPCAIEKGRTYIMKLTVGNVRMIVEHAQTKQFLYIELNPADATLEINGKLKVTDNGVYQELLPYGRYQYKVYCPNYHDLDGVVEVNEQKQSLNLKLKAAFGYVSVLDNASLDYTGASVYVDDKLIGKIPVNNLQLSSGSHKVRVMKEMYEPYSEMITVSDEEVRQLIPAMVPDFAEVTLSTSSGASIYVNGEFKDNYTWKGRLATGSYVFESRQEGHIPYKMSYDITRNDHAKTIRIDAPIPVYGSLIISSDPSKAKIYIDDVYVGDTPLYVPRQVIGEHRVMVKWDEKNYSLKSISLDEGQELELEYKKDSAEIYNEEEMQRREESLRSALEKALNETADDPLPSSLVDDIPTFMGGDANQFSKWVSQRLVYPEVARSNGVQGRVTLQFIIEKDGSLSNVKVLRGVDPVLDKEAVRVVSMSPKWTSGKINGKPVRVSYVFPVIFYIN